VCGGAYVRMWVCAYVVCVCGYVGMWVHICMYDAPVELLQLVRQHGVVVGADPVLRWRSVHGGHPGRRACVLIGPPLTGSTQWGVALQSSSNCRPFDTAVGKAAQEAQYCV
jgi:hypothetical protein